MVSVGSTTGGAMKSFVAMLIAFLVLVGLISWKLGLIPTTPTQRYAQDEILCGALTVLADTKAEPPPRSNEVDVKVANTILAYARLYKTDLCKIFREQLTLTPLGSVRKGVPNRNKMYMWVEFTSDEVNAAQVLFERVAKGPDTSWEATHYIRAPRKRTFGNQTQEEINAIRSTMDKIRKRKVMDSTGKGHDDPAEGIIEFYKPRI